MLIAPGCSGWWTECVGPATTGYTRYLGRLYLKTHMTEPIAGVPRGRGARSLPVTSTRATGVASEGGMHVSARASVRRLALPVSSQLGQALKW